VSSRELYALLHLLAKFDAEVRCDEPAHLAVLILKIQAEKKLSERKELG
jgi:hypothetical protein